MKLLSVVLQSSYSRLAVYLIWLSVFVLSTSVAVAAMPEPDELRERRRQDLHAGALASFHVRVKVIKVKEPAQTPGACLVTGKVVRIYRDVTGTTLHQGARLDFTVTCKKQDEPTLLGGPHRTDYEWLMKAKYVEVFLNRARIGHNMSLWERP